MPEKKAKKVDRRIQRTRALLRESLMTLIIERGYDDITIQDITDEANVARTTFYLHFKDKDELLFGTMRDVYEGLYEKYQEANSLEEQLLSWMNEADCDATEFLHVAEYADFYRIMLSERGSAAFLTQVRTYLAEAILEDSLTKIATDSDPNVPLEAMAYMMAGSLIGSIKWWLDNDMQFTPQRMAYLTQQFMTRGLHWGLNIDTDNVLAALHGIKQDG